jgi:antitoxin HicB
MSSSVPVWNQRPWCGRQNRRFCFRGIGTTLHGYGACRSRKIWYANGMKFRVHVEADEDGVFVAECPTLPGCISQGDTREAALTNIKDAIAGYIFSLEKHGEAVPLPVNEEVVEVAA